MLVRVESLRQMLGITEVRGRKYFPACGLNTNDNEIEAKFSVHISEMASLSLENIEK